MKVPALLGLGVLIIAGSVLVLWLTVFVNAALAWLALIALAALVLGGIWLGLRSVRRDPWAGLAKQDRKT